MTAAAVARLGPRRRRRRGAVRPSAGGEHARERVTKLRAHGAVDEEVGRVREQNDEVD